MKAVVVAITPIPPALRPMLTARELTYCVELLGHGVTLQQAIDRIQAERPTLPFTPEAA